MLFLIASCKENNKLTFKKENLNSEIQDTIIQNISKSCDEVQMKNIFEYYFCKDWDILNEAEIKKIIKSAELGDGGEGDSRTLHYTTSESPIWITADMIIGVKKYRLKINAGSYFYLTDESNIVSLYFCKSNKFRTFFISGIGTEDDNIYARLKSENRNKVESIKTNLNSWKGEYNFDNGNFEQSYKSYHVKIENNNCVFYQGDLPATEIECLIYQNSKELFLYVKSESFKESKFDKSLYESLGEGDFLLKIKKRKNKIYIQSPKIKYWNEKNKKFEDNIDIETEFVSKL